MNQSLAELVTRGKIARKEAMEYSLEPDELDKLITTRATTVAARKAAHG